MFVTMALAPIIHLNFLHLEQVTCLYKILTFDSAVGRIHGKKRVLSVRKQGKLHRHTISMLGQENQN